MPPCQSRPVSASSTSTSGVRESAQPEVKAMVVRSELDLLFNRSAVLVHGLMAAGKSTFIQVQQGATFESGLMDDGMKHGLKIIHRPAARGPKTSDREESCTLNSSLYTAWSEVLRRNIDYLDNAGIDEARGLLYALWARFCRASSLSLISSVEAVAVVIDVSSTLGGNRSKEARTLAVKLADTFGTGDSAAPFYRSMIFIFTKARDAGTGFPMTLAQIKYKARAIQAVSSIRNNLQLLFHGHICVDCAACWTIVRCALRVFMA